MSSVKPQGSSVKSGYLAMTKSKSVVGACAVGDLLEQDGGWLVVSCRNGDGDGAEDGRIDAVTGWD